MRLLLSLLLLAAIPVAQAQTPDAAADAWATLSRCAESVQADASDAESELESGELRGLDEFEARCPQLKAALQELGIEESITESSREAFTVVQLIGLQKLSKWYGEPAEADSDTRDIDPGALDQALQKVDTKEVERTPSLWQQATAWLRDLFGRKAKKEEQTKSWTDKVEVSDAVRKTIYWSVVALVIALATGVVLNELRAAGVLRAEPPSSRSGRGGSATPQSLESLGIEDLDRVPLRERPSLLLRVLIATLTKTGRLTTAKALTHRELTSRATFDENAQRDSFQRVSGLAERALYSSDELPPEQVERIVAEGRSLDASLRGAAT